MHAETPAAPARIEGAKLSEPERYQGSGSATLYLDERTAVRCQPDVPQIRGRQRWAHAAAWKNVSALWNVAVQASDAAGGDAG
jgi:hypothetical protein